MAHDAGSARSAASAASDLNRWQPAAFAGHVWIGDAGCTRCHGDGGPADDLVHRPFTRGGGLVDRALATPDSILPGPVPPAKLRQAHAIAMYVARLQRGPLPPAVGALALVVNSFSSTTSRGKNKVHRIRLTGGTGGRT